MSDIRIGARVAYIGQDSEFHGVLVERFFKWRRDLSGPSEVERCVVQNADGQLHIYRPEQLRPEQP